MCKNGERLSGGDQDKNEESEENVRNRSAVQMRWSTVLGEEAHHMDLSFSHSRFKDRQTGDIQELENHP